jgi:hypothetical protein
MCFDGPRKTCKLFKHATSSPEIIYIKWGKVMNMRCSFQRMWKDIFLRPLLPYGCGRSKEPHKISVRIIKLWLVYKPGTRQIQVWQTCALTLSSVKVLHGTRIGVFTSKNEIISESSSKTNTNIWGSEKCGSVFCCPCCGCRSRSARRIPARFVPFFMLHLPVVWGVFRINYV